MDLRKFAAALLVAIATLAVAGHVVFSNASAQGSLAKKAPAAGGLASACKTCGCTATTTQTQTAEIKNGGLLTTTTTTTTCTCNGGKASSCITKAGYRSQEPSGPGKTVIRERRIENSAKAP